MAQTIKLKRSATEGAVPTTGSLELGEVAINTYDGKMYIKKNDGTESVVEIGEQYVLPFTDNSTNWNTAYSWGDHATAGYFDDAYHPNADKWTTARTLTLNGDVTGSVSWDGSANVTLTAAVGNDSHDHSRLVEKSNIAYGVGQLQWTDVSGAGGSGANGGTPTNPTSDWYHHIIANHSNSGGYYYDLSLPFHQDELFFRRVTNGTQGAFRKVWHDGNDGSGSGLDADLLDGQQGSYYYSPSNSTELLNFGSDITSQDWNTYIDGTEASYNCVLNMSGANRPTAYGYGIAVNFGKSGQAGLQIYAPESGTNSNGIYVRTKWNTGYRPWRSLAMHGINPQTGGSLYADTFYDSDNTGYYVNPASTSVLNALQLNGVLNTGTNVNLTLQRNGSNVLTAVSGATYLYPGGSSTVALTLQSGRTIAPILSIGQVNNYVDVIDSSRNLTNIGNITSTADNSFLSMGVAGAGSTVGARFLSIEGNTDTSGEGSGRIFFTEHNSTTAAMDSYGMSIGYRGGADTVEGASGNTWDGLSQIGNGQWGMSGHNASASGSLIMYGDRAASFINFAGNGLDGVGRVRFSDTSPTLLENNNYLRILNRLHQRPMSRPPPWFQEYRLAMGATLIDVSSDDGNENGSMSMVVDQCSQTSLGWG